MAMVDCPECHQVVDDTARFCPHCGTAVTATVAPVDPFVGRVVNGKFRVEKMIGQGGMGRVYRAHHLTLDRPVVLKMLHRAYSSDPQLVQRFQREARAASRLDHPNSIAVLDFGESEDGTLFMAMEFLAGKDLGHVVADEFPLSEARIVRIGAQVLSALAEAHARGIIHRDLKPENVMVVPRRDNPDFVKVLDFGIAKIVDASESDKLTQAGLVCGTPEYMSPEQARGATLDARSDLYSMGVLLYQLCTGDLPFQSDTPVGFLTAHLSAVPLPPRQKRPDLVISPALDALITRALEKDPANRFASADEMRAALLACAPGAADIGGGVGVAPATTSPQPTSPGRTTAPGPATTPPRTQQLSATQQLAPGAQVAPASRPSTSPPAGPSQPVGPSADLTPPRPSRRAFWVFVAAMIVAVAGGGTVVWMVRKTSAQPHNFAETQTPPKDPTTAAKDPATAAQDPTTAAKDPTTAAKDPATAAQDPTTAAKDPATAAQDPTTAAKDPATAPKDPKIARGTTTTPQQDLKKLARAYQLKGDKKRAAELYRRYLATNPRDADQVILILSTLE